MSRLRRLSLGFRITALSVGVGLVLSVIAATAALTATTNRTDASRLTDRIGPVAISAQRLMSLVLTQQSSLTQYAATGQEQHLNQYNRAVSELDVLYRSTERLVAREPALRSRLESISNELAGWRRIGWWPR